MNDVRKLMQNIEVVHSVEICMFYVLISPYITDMFLASPSRSWIQKSLPNPSMYFLLFYFLLLPFSPSTRIPNIAMTP